MCFQAVVELLSHALSLRWDLIPNCQNIPGFTCWFTCHYWSLLITSCHYPWPPAIPRGSQAWRIPRVPGNNFHESHCTTLINPLQFVSFCAMYCLSSAYHILLFCDVLCTLEPRPGTTWTMCRTSASFLADCLSEIGSSCKEPQGRADHGDPGWLLQNYPTTTMLTVLVGVGCY